MRDVVAMVARPVGRSGRLERVEGLAYRSVSDGVHVHLEPLGIQASHVPVQRARLDEGESAATIRLIAQVRLDQGGGEVLDDAILHDLDRRGSKPASGRAGATFEELVD